MTLNKSERRLLLLGPPFERHELRVVAVDDEREWHVAVVYREAAALSDRAERRERGGQSELLVPRLSDQELGAFRVGEEGARGGDERSPRAKDPEHVRGEHDVELTLLVQQGVGGGMLNGKSEGEERRRRWWRGGAHGEVLINSAIHIPEHPPRLDPRRAVGVGVATRARDDLRRAVRREDARRAELMRDDL